MRANFIRLASYALILFFLGCGSKGPLAKNDVESVLREAGIEHVSTVEQLPQDEGSVTLIVDSDARSTSFSGCVRKRTDIEVVRSDSGWATHSMSDHVQLALSACRATVASRYVLVDGSYTDERVDESLVYLKSLIGGSVATNYVFGSPSLKQAVGNIDLADISGVLIRDGYVEFQFMSKALAPQLLGVRVLVEHGRLKAIYLNGDNGASVVDP